MKKIRKFYREHRVFTILMAIAIVCAIIIGTVLVQCFYVGNDTSKYGDRLEGIENFEIDDDERQEIESKIVEKELIKTASVLVTGKIIYISIDFEPTVDLVQGESIALETINLFDEEKQSFYDFQFTLRNSGTENNPGFLISGARNLNGSGLVWNNNNPVTTPSTETDKTEADGE